jgi:hypothetical protein
MSRPPAKIAFLDSLGAPDVNSALELFAPLIVAHAKNKARGGRNNEKSLAHMDRKRRRERQADDVPLVGARRNRP